LTVAEQLRPIHRWAPRGYGFFYKLLLGKSYGSYPGDPELKQKLDHRYRVFRDQNLDAYVCADLGDWASRAHYYKGIYYDRTVPLLIDRLLSGGGTFVDVGANRGLHTLHAARVLGSRGHVYSFEPNPDTFDVLKAHLVMNQLRNCTPMNIGIADVTTELKLNLFSDDHSGTCSFVRSGEVAKTVSVPVHPLDTVLDAASLAGPIFVKIDVEGFEHQVLKGMTQILSRNDVTVLCELTDEWLRKTGSSIDAVVSDMSCHGYRMLLPEVHYRRWIKEVLDLRAVDKPPKSSQFDAVFVRSH
jgi:FkbM family methyltransferase